MNTSENTHKVPEGSAMRVVVALAVLIQVAIYIFLFVMGDSFALSVMPAGSAVMLGVIILLLWMDTPSTVKAKSTQTAKTDKGYASHLSTN